jgi:hypothetical protein
MLELLLGDVFDAKTDALLLTVDGMTRNIKDSVRPIRGGKEILGGNIANQFAKRWPEDWEDMQFDIPFPIPIGRSIGIAWDGDCPYRLIVLASTLHHIGEWSDAEKLAIIRSAFTEALAIAVRHNIRSMSTAALKGGWRLSLADTADAMLATYQQSDYYVQRVNLVMATTSSDEIELFGSIAKKYGLR